MAHIWYITAITEFSRYSGFAHRFPLFSKLVQKSIVPE